MIKKDKKKIGGIEKTQIRVVEGYRPGAGMAPKQRTIKSFGYLEDQEDQEEFMNEVKAFDARYKAEKKHQHIGVDMTAKMYDEENRKQNYGYKFLESIYNMLEIDKFIKKTVKKNQFRGNYELTEILKLLVFTRILSPDSKRASFQIKNSFYGMKTEFELPNVYRALGVLSEMELEIQQHLNKMIKKKIGRDLSHAFYDVTNYFFEIDFPNSEDDLRKRGVSKEHRVDPIVAMGLFIDNNGIPVNMSLFPGNTSETLTLQPTMSDIKKSYKLGRLVVIADKGLNSSKNINALINEGDGYVFSQIIKGKKGKRYHEKLFDDQDWITNQSGTYRYKQFEEEYMGMDASGKKVVRKRNVLLYWNEAEAKRAKRKREEKLEKAMKSVNNNAYSIKKGVDEYTKENIIDKQTGEILSDALKKRSVDIEKAEQDARYDGYFCLITSEMDYNERKIRQVYGSLWRIEQSFRMLKSDLCARPVFVSKNEHIRAHFLICFISLLIIRIIQHRMGQGALSSERIARSLRAATCRLTRGGIVHLDDVGGALAFKKRRNKEGFMVDTLQYTDQDEIALDYQFIQQTFGMTCTNIYFKQELFNQFLKNIARA